MGVLKVAVRVQGANSGGMWELKTGPGTAPQHSLLFGSAPPPLQALSSYAASMGEIGQVGAVLPLYQQLYLQLLRMPQSATRDHTLPAAVLS